MTAVARIERDENEPRMTTLRKLADVLGVEPRDILEG
jgi:transcriptional regulator with XRE-family HTH domain